jgi:hypothetical protein
VTDRFIFHSSESIDSLTRANERNARKQKERANLFLALLRQRAEANPPFILTQSQQAQQ